MVFGLNDKGGNISGKGLSILGASFDDIKLGLSPVGKAQIDIVEKYNKAIQDTLNPVTAYYRALDDGTGTTVKCNKATRDLIASANGAAVSQETMSTALKATSLSSQAAAAGMKALAIAGNMVAVMAAAWALQKLVEGIDYVIHEEEKLAEKSSTLRQEYKSLSDEIASTEDQLKTMGDRIKELESLKAPSLADENELARLKESNAELERQKTLKEQLLNIAKLEAEKAAVQTISTISDNGKNPGYISNISGEMKGNRPSNKIDFAKEQMVISDDYKAKIEDAQNQQLALGEITATTQAEYNKLQQSIDAYAEKQSDANKNVVESVSFLNEQKQGLNGATVEGDRYKQSIDELLVSYDQWTQVDLTSKFDSVANSSQFSDVTAELKALANEGRLTAETFSDPRYSEFLGALNKVGISSGQAANQINSLKDSSVQLAQASSVSAEELEAQDQKSKALIADLDLLNGTLDKLKSGYVFNRDEMATLIAKYSELAGAVIVTSDGYKIEENALNSLIGKKAEEANVSIATQIAMTKKAIEDAKIRIETYKAELQALAALSNAQLKMVSDFYASGKQGPMPLPSLYEDAAYNKLQQLIGGQKALNDATSQLEFLSNSLGSTMQSSFSAGTSAAKQTTSAVNDLKQAMSSAQSSINTLLTMTMNMIKQQYADKKEQKQRELDDIKNNYDAEKKGIEANKKASDAAYKANKKALDDSAKAQQKIFDRRRKELENQAKQQQKMFDDQKEALQDQMDAYEKIINRQLELLRLKEEERDYQKELSEKQKDVSDLEAEIAVKSLDTSEEGIRKRLELEEELARQKEELDELQHDRGVDLTEEALKKELEQYQEQLNNKIDILEKEQEIYNENHQARLDALEAEREAFEENHQAEIDALEAAHEREQENFQQQLDNIDMRYEASRSAKEKEIQDIDDFVKKESNIRAEAIKMIETEGEKLKEKLLEWNREYGDGLDSTVITGWNNAQAAMEQFNGAQLGVLGVLNDLALRMNDLVQNTNNAAAAMANLNKERANQNALEEKDWKQKLADAGGLSGTQYGKGSKKQVNHNGTGSVGKPGKTYHDGKLKPDEVESVLQIGEGIIPVNNPRRAVDVMTDFINSNSDVKSFLAQSASATPAEISYKGFESFSGNAANMPAPDLSKYERFDYNTPITISLGDTQIMGNADSEVMDKWFKSREGQIKNLFTKDVFDTINKNHRMNGGGRSVNHHSL